MQFIPLGKQKQKPKKDNGKIRLSDVKTGEIYLCSHHLHKYPARYRIDCVIEIPDTVIGRTMAKCTRNGKRKSPKEIIYRGKLIVKTTCLNDGSLHGFRNTRTFICKLK